MIKVTVKDEINNSLISLDVDYNSKSEIEIGLLKGTKYVVTKIIKGRDLYVIDEDIWRKRHLMIVSDGGMTLEELEYHLYNMGYELNRIKN